MADEQRQPRDPCVDFLALRTIRFRRPLSYEAFNNMLDEVCGELGYRGSTLAEMLHNYVPAADNPGNPGFETKETYAMLVSGHFVSVGLLDSRILPFDLQRTEREWRPEFDGLRFVFSDAETVAELGRPIIKAIGKVRMAMHRYFQRLEKVEEEAESYRAETSFEQ